MLIDNSIHGISDIKSITLGSTINKNQAIVLLQDEDICSEGDLEPLHVEGSVVDKNGHILPGTSELEPVNTTGVSDEPVVGKRSHGLTSIIQDTLVTKIVESSGQIGTPDDNPLLRINERRNTVEVAVPTPEVIVIIVELINGGSNNLTISIHDPGVEFSMKRAWDELGKLTFSPCHSNEQTSSNQNRTTHHKRAPIN